MNGTATAKPNTFLTAIRQTTTRVQNKAKRELAPILRKEQKQLTETIERMADEIFHSVRDKIKQASQKGLDNIEVYAYKCGPLDYCSSGKPPAWGKPALHKVAAKLRKEGFGVEVEGPYKGWGNLVISW